VNHFNYADFRIAFCSADTISDFEIRLHDSETLRLRNSCINRGLPRWRILTHSTIYSFVVGWKMVVAQPIV
jgi:hypothetical protein